MVLSELLRCRISKHSSLRKVHARFFFEPGHVCGQFSDFGVQLFAMLVVVFFVGPGFGLSFEEGGEALDGAGLPGAEHVGMDCQTGSDLAERPLFLECFEGGFGFEIRGMLYSRVALRLAYFCRSPRLDYPDHYNH